jgi:hypothetical protein
MDKAWSDKHTLRLYGALSFNGASILGQARTEHCGLDACLFRKKCCESASHMLEDSMDPHDHVISAVTRMF